MFLTFDITTGRSARWLNIMGCTCFLSVCLLVPSEAKSQAVHDFGSWFSLNTQGKLNRVVEDSKWRWWFDGHLRYLDDADGFNQSIFRPGIGYQLTPNANLWIGYGPKFEIGYLNQFIRRQSADDRFNHILFANWFWSF